VPATAVAATGATRDPREELRLARLHLRLGMLPAARAELEDLAGLGLLDNDGQAALAEARWRTGDLEAAEDPAEAHLRDGGRDAIAAVIAAEAAAAAGRTADARDRMARVAGLDAVTLDALFAGMPRRAHWPVAASPGPAEGGSIAGAGFGAAELLPPGSGGASGGRIRASAVPTPADVLAANADLWDEAALGAAADAQAPARPAGRPTWVEPARARGHADPEAELETARDELSTAPDRGLLRLALVLRLDPTLASEVLEAVRLRREAAAVVLRGDAQRLLGRHLEAEASFADAIESIERDAVATGHHQPPVPATPDPADHLEDS
jgi:hypothetical protein